MSDYTPKQLRNFWKKVVKSTDDNCWEWTASKDYKGYGKFLRERAHRVSWKIAYGEIPDGLFVCHHCDNRKCVNPKHLFLGTNQDNMNDMKAKGRQVFWKGEAHPMHKLTREQVNYIRQRFAVGDISKAQLGREMSVSESQIRWIVNYWSWKD